MTRKSFFSSLTVLALAVCLLFTLGCAAFASGDPAFDGILDTSEFFSDRDLEQSADLTGSVSYTLNSGEDIHITAEGVYVLSGSASDVTVYVEAGDQDKVQIVLDGAEIANSSFPCIYAKTADKVFVTTSADSTLSVAKAFTKDGDTNTDGVIFSSPDLTLNGTAALKISSSENGIVCKDDLRVTGGRYEIEAEDRCVDVNDSLRIADGEFVLTADKDALHADHSTDANLGYIYIGGGSFVINAGDDGIRALSVVQIDGGDFDITADEGIDSTYVQLNGGTISIEARDDGVNGAEKSSAYQPTIEVNGGAVSVTMSVGKTIAFDCRGDITINGGTVDVTAGTAFTFDGTGLINGGTVTVNGEQVSTLS